MTQRFLLLYSLLGLAACGDAPPETDTSTASPTIIFCGVLIDGISNSPTIDRTISIVDSRIVSISEVKPTSGDFLDLSAYTCLPGLIDTHTHIMDNAGDTVDLSVYYDRTPAEELEIAKKNSAVTLAAGFTTVRNLGAYGGWGARGA